jgi:hypothetical protein
MSPEAVQIAESLRKKLREVEAAYERAADEYKRLISASENTSIDDAAVVDGMLALRAMVIHQQARLEYEQALRMFTDFAL